MALVERLAILIDANSQGATREFRKLSAEAKTADAQLTKTQKASTLAGGALKSLGVVAGAAAVAGIAKFADASIEAASALEEARSKATVVFGEQFSQIKRFAEETAGAFNLSKREAFQFTAAFGQLFDSVGLTDQQTAEYSSTLTALAGDLASFNDISVDEAFQKLRSGLSGEAEPLRQVGVFLSAAKVEAEAYSSGIAEVGSTLTEAQKAQARYNIILRETATAQGDVERTSDSLANTQRDLAATTENLQAQLGEDLAPIKRDLLNFASGLTGAIANIDTFLKSLDDETVFGGLFEEPVDSAAALDVELRRIQGSLNQIGLAPLANEVDDFAIATSGTVDGLRELPPAIDDTVIANRDLLDGLGQTEEALNDIPTPTRKYLDEVLKVAPATDDFAAASRALLAGIEPLAPATDDLVGPTSELGGKFAYAGDKAKDASAAIEVLTDALDKMRSPVLDVREAQRNLAEALDVATDAIDDNGRTLDINTEKGRENQGALDAIAESAFDALNAYAENGASAERLTDRTENLRAKLIEAAERFGLTKKEARQYADQLGLIPGNITTNVRLAGIDSAIEQAKELSKLTTGLSVSQLTSVVRQDRAMANRRASGGPVGDGLYLVGEQGPELLDLRGGTGRVTSNAQTRPMLSNNNSRNLTVNGNVTFVTPDPSRTWDVLNDLAVA